MTSQTQKFIELADILALHFRCKNCGASLSMSPREYEKRQKPGMLNSCPMCSSSWAVVNGSSCEVTVTEFVKSLEKLIQVLGKQQGAFPAGFSLSLAIRDGENE
jgi:hypothetical protein